MGRRVLGEQKNMYSSRNVYKNSFLSVVYQCAGLLLSLVSVPLLLDCLGEEKYGVWAALLSFVSWLYYMELGIGNGLRIRLSECFARGESENAKKYITVSYLLLTVITLIIFAITSAIIMFTRISNQINIPMGFDENIKVIILISSGFVCLNLTLSIINSVLYALQRASAVSALTLQGQVAFIIGLMIYKVIGGGYLLVISILQGMAQVVKNIIGSLYTYIKYPSCRIRISDVDFSYSKGIVSFGIQTFIVNLAALILNATDNILILQLFGAEQVTPYSLCYRYFESISGVFAAVVIPLESAYTMAYTVKDKGWIEKNLRRSILAWVVFATGTIIAVFLFRPFTIIWLSKRLLFEKGLISSMALYVIVLMATHVLSVFTRGIGRIKEGTVVSIIQAIINIPISIWLATRMELGVTGILWGSVISLTIGLIVGLFIVNDERGKLSLYEQERDNDTGK